MSADAALVSQAIVVWTGWGSSSWPSCDDGRLVERFGVDQALDLVPSVRRLTDEFYESDAKYVAADHAEMGEIASRRFHDLHPEISDEAVRALAWCYTYDYK